MNTHSAKELVGELNKYKIEASKLRQVLNKLDQDKESWFKKTNDYSQRIRELIRKVKEFKEKRDSLTKEVRELKPRRDNINNDTSAKLKEFDKLKKEKLEIAKSLDVRDSPSRIKQNIEKLEFKIETEPMSFDKEQAIMKNIKVLKKLYDNSSTLMDANNRLDGASNVIKKMRKEANETHTLIQEKAKQSQSLHEEILRMSEEIDKIKLEEDASFKKFSELKHKFTETNSQIKENLKLLNEVKSRLDKIRSERKEKGIAEQESFLKAKEEEVNQKFKRGEKLTTDDLLIFQKFGKG